MRQFLLATVPVITFCVFLGGADGQTGAPTWKPFLPADAYKELTERSIKAIEAIAKSDAKDAAEKIEVEAAILVGYTLSVKNADDDEVAKLRGAALKAAQMARDGDLKKLAGFRKTIASAPAAVPDVKRWKAVLQERQWMMEAFRGKAKGGEGLNPALHYHPKLKNLNGIEAFIGALAGKKLSDENLDKIAKELPNLAYRVAVIGALTYELPPEKNVAAWHALSVQMRDAAIALGEAGQKKNADSVLKAAQTLENSCTQCHMKFKKI